MPTRPTTCSGCSAGWPFAATRRRAACCASTSRYGHFWARAIDRLIGDDDALHAGTPWPEVVGGLDAVLVERFATHDALAEAVAGLDPRERPWTMWSVENRAIARAFALEQRGGGATAATAGGASQAAHAARRAPEGRRRPREMSTAELLQIAEDSRWTQIADELATRSDRGRRRAARRRGARPGGADAPRGDPRARAPGPARGAADRRAGHERARSAASCRARSRSRWRRCRSRRRARSRTTG